ncbi:MAG: ArnT family glycosyltransferase, partial [Planctomycetaceae bacterium]
MPLDPADSRATERLDRFEIAWVVLALAAGLVLRGAHLERTAVEHFDEGVYASNVWFGEAEGFQYPGRPLYAPPLLPALIEWPVLLLGPTHLATMLPSLLFGNATVLLVWWTARRWFGRTAGLAAITLAATSGFHALYSRAALTDAALGFWLLLAVSLTWEALQRPGGLWWIVAAGVATGLAWWTKYNGWLPLAIGAAGLVASLVLRGIVPLVGGKL